MHKLLIVFIGCLLLLSCREQQKASPFFEGYVEYDLNFQIFDTLEGTRQDANFKGDRMICYFKDGYYLREYYSKNTLLPSKYLYSPKRNKFYYIFSNGKTYEFAATYDSVKSRNLRISDGKHKTILDYDCPSMITQSEYIDKNDTLRMTGQMFFCQKLLVDTALLKEITSSGYNRMISKYPNVAIGIVQESAGHFRETYTATRIVHKKLKGGFFSVPDGEIIKL